MVIGLGDEYAGGQDLLDSVILLEESDGSYSIRKANYHEIQSFGSDETSFDRALAHAHSIARDVIVECKDPREF